MPSEGESRGPRQTNGEICAAIEQTFLESPFKEILGELQRKGYHRYGDPEPLTSAVKAAIPEEVVRDLLHALDFLVRSEIPLDHAAIRWVESSAFALYSILEARDVVQSGASSDAQKPTAAAQPPVVRQQNWFVAGLQKVFGKQAAQPSETPKAAVPAAQKESHEEHFDVQALESLLRTRDTRHRFPSTEQTTAVVRRFLLSPDLLTTEQLLLALNIERGKGRASETELLKRFAGDAGKLRRFRHLQGAFQEGTARAMELLAACEGLTARDHLDIMDGCPARAGDHLRKLIAHPQTDTALLVRALYRCPASDLPILAQAFLAREPDADACAAYLDVSQACTDDASSGEVMRRFFALVDEDPRLLEESVPLQDRFSGECANHQPGHLVREALLKIVKSGHDPFALRALETFRALDALTYDERLQLHEADPVRALDEGLDSLRIFALALPRVREVSGYIRAVLDHMFRTFPALTDEIIVPVLREVMMRPATPKDVRESLLDILRKHRPDIANTIVLPTQPSLRDALDDLHKRGEA